MEEKMNENVKKPKVRGRNIFVIVLTFVCAAATAIGTTGTVAIANTGASIQEALNHTEYFALRHNQAHVASDAYNRLNAEVSEDSFWVDGTYDGEQTVDITMLTGGIRVSDKDPSTTYKMADLVTMYQAGLDTKLRDLLSNEGELETDYPEIISQMESNYGTDTYYVDNLGNLYASVDYNAGDIDLYLNEMPFEPAREAEVSESAGMLLYTVKRDSVDVCRELPEGFEGLETIGWNEFSARYMLDFSDLDDRTKSEIRYEEYGYFFQYLYKYGKDLETLLPLSGEKLAVYALKNPAEVSILDCYKQLATAIETVGSAVVNEEYKNVPVVEEGEIPLSLYWVRDLESGKVWTNNQLWENLDMEQVEQEIYSREGSEEVYPFYYGERAYAEAEYEGYNIEHVFAADETDGWYSYMADLMIQELGIDSVEYVVAMNPAAWDYTVYADLDPTGYDDNRIYNIHMPYTLEYLILLIGGCIGTAIFFIASIVMAGRRDKTKVRYAGPITTKLPIEGLLLIDIGSWVAYGIFVFCLFRAEITDNFGALPGEMLAIFIMMMLFAALVVWQVLTLVAKGKSKNMRTNSWFGRAGSGLEKTARSRFSEKCPIEIMLVLFLVIWIIYAAVVNNIYWSLINVFFGLREVIYVLIVLAGIVILAYWQIASLVHKARSKNMTTNSLIKRFGGGIVRAVKNAYRNRKVTGKMVICSVIFCVINLIFIGLAVATYAVGIFIFLLIVFWIVTIGLLMKKCMQKQRLKEGIHEIAGGNLEYQIQMDKMTGDELDMARDLNNLKDGMETAVERMMKSERMKTDLITNVSHDLKTPLTSIINYVDILKKEDIQDEKIRGYINILEQKSLRLKNLTEDLMEAAKISSGNITLDMQNINLKALLYQTNAEFEEKFARRNLSLVCTLPESDVYIKADGRRMWRVIENLYNNAAKYAQPYSRVYVDGKLQAGKVILIIKNVSEAPLNISADELMERFVRGDVARNTEGSGLGLEIARNLTVMQKGTFDIQLDGDLFKVILTFDAV